MKKWLVYLTLYLALALSIAFLPGSCDRAQGADAGYENHIVTEKYVTLTYASDNVRYQVEVIADLSQLLKEHGDDSRLLRIIDHDAHTVIYVILNDTGEMFTGLQVLSRKDIHVFAPLYKRLWR